jgi:hypothetical protein
LIFSTIVLVIPCGAHAVVLIDQNFESQAVLDTIDTFGWVLVAETGGPPIVREESPGGNKYIVTSTVNNQPARYQLPFINPGFFSGTTLTITADLWDPFVTENPGQLSTFPRAVLGIYELAKPSAMPPYFGIETNDGDLNDDVMTGEWVVSGENFGNPPNPTPRTFASDGPAQDTWYTVKSEWNLGTKKMNMLVKPRDSADPFTTVFSDITLGFDDPNQNMAALDALQIRMLRGTRLDNIKVEYDVVMPPGTPGDYNDDDKVDAGDYVTWRDNFGQVVTLPNDTTGISPIGDAQFQLWRANFGNPPGSSASLSAAVPEPATWVAAILLVLQASFARRRL